jgi:hypothetical protein
MPTPTVQIGKQDYQTGVVGPSPTGVLAILAFAAAGPVNVPQSFTRDDLVQQAMGPGRLTEDSSYVMATGGNAVVAQRPTASTAGGYSAIDLTGSPTGTSIVVAGAATPVDNYDVIVTWVTGGVIGAAGLQYNFSLDGGLTKSATQALPTGAAPIVLAIPNFTAGGSPGVSFSCPAGSVVTGEFLRCLVKAPQMNDADITTALTALGLTNLPWEGVLIDSDIASTTPGVVDTFLLAQEKLGKFRFAITNTRMKNQLHVGSGVAETEAAYATAMTTLANAAAPTIRAIVGTDGAAVPSTLTGATLPRPTSLLVAARAMQIPLGEDPSFVGRGPLNGATIVDSNASPLFHNEELFANLDALRLTALRSVQGQKGVYINNANVFGTSTSDYQFLQHIRTMNRACEIAFQLLTTQLSRGVGKKPKDQTTGLVYILESDAQVIEDLVNSQVNAQLFGQVAGAKFTLSRTDDLSSNAGATVTGFMKLVALAYIKKFSVTASFAKSL